MANQSSAAGYPTWRYYYNASIANIQPVPQLADFKAFHSSEIRLVFGTYPKEGATAQEVALSQYMKGAWAQFARNPVLGPGWNELGTYDADLGALGTKGSAGVTVIKQSDVDSRCAILAPIYGSF
jgi:acetylcholinesterase